jgi:hypothetical protein
MRQDSLLKNVNHRFAMGGYPKRKENFYSQHLSLLSLAQSSTFAVVFQSLRNIVEIIAPTVALGFKLLEYKI